MTLTLEIFKICDVIALLEAIPEHNLIPGQVGTIVEELAPNVYEVEFIDDEGQTYAMLPLQVHQILRLHYSPTQQ
ncbi:MAG: DUF4926 domain-containing protein [Planktothrix sp.]